MGISDGCIILLSAAANALPGNVNIRLIIQRQGMQLIIIIAGPIIANSPLFHTGSIILHHHIIMIRLPADLRCATHINTTVFIHLYTCGNSADTIDAQIVLYPALITQWIITDGRDGFHRITFMQLQTVTREVDISDCISGYRNCRIGSIGRAIISGSPQASAIKILHNGAKILCTVTAGDPSGNQLILGFIGNDVNRLIFSMSRAVVFDHPLLGAVRQVTNSSIIKGGTSKEGIGLGNDIGTPEIINCHGSRNIGSAAGAAVVLFPELRAIRVKTHSRQIEEGTIAEIYRTEGIDASHGIGSYIHTIVRATDKQSRIRFHPLADAIRSIFGDRKIAFQ